MSSGERKTLTVPKFASFKKKDARAAEPTEPTPASDHNHHSSNTRSSTRSSRREDDDKNRRDDRHKRQKHSSRDGSRDGREHGRRREHEYGHGRSRRSPSPSDRHVRPGPGEAPPSRSSKKEEEPPRSSEASALFVVDKRGDPLIVRYGSNDRSRVPAYRRAGRGRVLGSKGAVLVIELEGSREVFYLRRPGGGDRGSAFRESHAALLKSAGTAGTRGANSKQARRAFFVRREVDGEKNNPPSGDFVPLSNNSSRKRKRGRDGVEGGAAASSDEGDHPFRSTEAFGAAERDSTDSDFSSEEDLADADDGGYDDLETRKEFIELSRRVKDHPDDVDSWLRLIKLQEIRSQFGLQIDTGPVGEFIGGENDEQGGHNDDVAAKDKSLADVKLSMFESALPHARSDADRERLLLGLMREGSAVWSPKTLTKRCAKIAEEYPDSFMLWKARLDHIMTSVSTFKVENVKSFFFERIAFLKARLPLAHGLELALLSEQLVYVFLRATRFLHDSGFAELAIASWQAMLELIFCRPAELLAAGSSEETAMSSFKDFWESEAVRFGEPGSRGWSHFAETAEADEFPDPKRAAPVKAPETRDAYKAWAALEQQRALHGEMPARTMDEGAEDDPFRVVMFSDIADLLFILPESALPLSKSLLIEALLIFCRLPSSALASSFAGNDQGAVRLLAAARDDPFIVGDDRQLDQDMQRRSQMQDPLRDHDHDEDGPGKQPLFLHDQSRMALSPEVLFARPDTWFPYLPQPPHNDASRGPDSAYAWILNAVAQLTLSLGVEALSEYYLALRWQREPQSAKKAARSLLKLYPSNLALYQAYAHAEAGNGNAEQARNVLLSATSLKLDVDSTRAQALWNSLAWLELEALDCPRAVARLCSSVGNENDAEQEASTVTPARLLRTLQKLQTVRDYQLSAGNVEGATRFAESYTLVMYLTSDEACAEPRSDKQGNISAAVRAVLSFSAELRSRGALGQSSAHERLLQFASKLLYFHTTQGPFRPKFLREHLLHFVEFFPTNTIFLALYAWSQSSSPRIDDPVRDVLWKTLLTEEEKSHGGGGARIATHFFAIRHELVRPGGNAHSTRAAFERAISLTSGGGGAAKNNAALWGSYIRFCCSSRELLSKPVGKDAFFRAMAACPWSRDVAMEGFGDALLRGMATAELRAVFGTMTARGLRVRVDLEEFVEEWRSKHTSSKMTK